MPPRHGRHVVQLAGPAVWSQSASSGAASKTRTTFRCPDCNATFEKFSACKVHLDESNHARGLARLRKQFADAQ